MSPVEFFKDLFTSDAQDEFLHLSDWQGAVVNYEGRLAVVETVDADDDATWLLVVYGSTRFDQHWTTTDYVEHLYQPTTQTTPAFASVAH